MKLNKKLSIFLIEFCILNFAFFINLSAQVAINTTGATADPSAILDVNSTNQGILIPRFTTTQRNLLPSPATGLLIYNTSTNLFNYYNGGEWYEIGVTFVTGTTGTVHPGGGVSINVTNTSPDSSAILDVNDTSRGILVPRLTGTITSPAIGLIIYNTSTNSFNYYNGSGWIAPCATSTGISGTIGSQSSIGTAFNTSGSPADSSAILDVSAADKGMLIPRLTNGQRNTIKAVNGLTIYNTDNNAIEYFKGTKWYMLEYHVPSTTVTPSSQTICSNASTGIALSSDVLGTAFAWSVTQTGVTGATSGTGSSIAQTLTNSGIIVGIATYTITPTANTCVGTSTNVVITVNPIPNITATPSSQTICGGIATNIILTSDVSGTTFAWTVAQSGVTGAYDGSGNSIAQTLINSGTSAGIATYSITPTYMNGGAICVGTSTNVVITVNPALNLVIAIPMVQTFTTVGPTTWTVPAGVSSVEYLIVAGGGAGGNGTNLGGGGGAGGVLHNSSYAVTPLTPISAGGLKSETNGGNSSFNGIVATGGGRGGTHSPSIAASIGGSGGGGCYWSYAVGSDGADGIAGQGNKGGFGSYPINGGGGGAGAAGTTYGAGGIGIDYSTNFGTTVGDLGWFGGGGAPGSWNSTCIAAVKGGGGQNNVCTGAETAGMINTGGGGGNGYSGKSGGSGIVIIKYMQTMPQQTICSGSATNIILSSNDAGATFAWSVTQNGVTGATAGSGSNIAQMLTYSASPGTATYAITSTPSCAGALTNVVITVMTTNNGAACTSGSDCCSGYCYIDSDGDRYSPSSGTMTCRASSQLIGTDCDDTNASIYPGAAGTGTTACKVCQYDGSYANSSTTTWGSGLYGCVGAQKHCYNGLCVDCTTNGGRFIGGYCWWQTDNNHACMKQTGIAGWCDDVRNSTPYGTNSNWLYNCDWQDPSDCSVCKSFYPGATCNGQTGAGPIYTQGNCYYNCRGGNGSACCGTNCNCSSWSPTGHMRQLKLYSSVFQLFSFWFF